MSIFLTEQEHAALRRACEEGNPVVARFRTALLERAERRANTPGLFSQGETTTWWYSVAEYLSDGAMAFALAPTPRLEAWVRDTTLSLVRRPESDWIGPWYRDHSTRPAVGNLETAHLCWAVGSARDLAAGAFSGAERAEIDAALREKGLALCRRRLEVDADIASWRAVVSSAVAVVAAVTGDSPGLRAAAAETIHCAAALQPDGSYSESVQYANYLAYGLMMAGVAIRRASPDLDHANAASLARMMPWMSASMLPRRPRSGWGEEPRAWAVNFHDSSALFRPSGDLLLYIAAYARDSAPAMAGLARWLFDELYATAPYQGPHNLATFGFRNDWGFLALPFLVRSADALRPAEAGLPPLSRFSNGHVLVRERWGSDSLLAIQGGTDRLHGSGLTHGAHGDLNSFVLVHAGEQMLTDPGYSCGRKLARTLERSSETHNTCTFWVDRGGEEFLLGQSLDAPSRAVAGGGVGDPLPPRGRCLLVANEGEVTVIGSDAADRYGDPIEEFTRTWIHAGRHVLFVVDRVRSSRPVRTVWNWLVDNRDQATRIEPVDGGDLLVRRRNVGLRLHHLGGGRRSGPVFGYAHDAYHPEPGQLGEGGAGSGLIYRWTEAEAHTDRVAVHTLVSDDAGTIGRWTIDADGSRVMVGPVDRWTLEVIGTEPLRLRLESGTGAWELSGEGRGLRCEAVHPFR